jgi:hypothetical protein
METTLTILGLAAGISGTVAALIGLRMAKWPHRDARRTGTIDQFLATREYQKEHVPQLVATALREQPRAMADPTIPMLTKPGWILSEPIPLSQAVLHRAEQTPECAIDAALETLRRYWPLRASGKRMNRYHEAVGAHDRPTSWFNGASYRLLDVAPTNGTLDMAFCDTWYWDMFDTTEALLYEAAFEHARTHGRTINGNYRRFLKDPFDLTRRCAIPGIDALTIRQEGTAATFYIHRRDATNVAAAQNVIGVVPAGEFQPSDDSWAARAQDFSLWHSIVREYAEEFLGLEDARTRMGAPIDYLSQPPYSLLHDAYVSMTSSPICLVSAWIP